MNASIDVTVVNNGSIYTFNLHSENAQNWVEENVEVPDYMCSLNGFHCEARFFADIAQGMIDEGLMLKFE